MTRVSPHPWPPFLPEPQIVLNPFRGCGTLFERGPPNGFRNLPEYRPFPFGISRGRESPRSNGVHTMIFQFQTRFNHIALQITAMVPLILSQIVHAPKKESGMLKMCTLLLVPLCQLTEDLVLVGNKLCKCLVGLRFVFLVFMFLGGGHCLLGRLGYFLFVLSFVAGGCDYSCLLRGWGSPTLLMFFLGWCRLHHEQLSLFFFVVVDVDHMSPVLGNRWSVEWPFVLLCSAVWRFIVLGEVLFFVQRAWLISGFLSWPRQRLVLFVVALG